jgi:hypothetical protein
MGSTLLSERQDADPGNFLTEAQKPHAERQQQREVSHGYLLKKLVPTIRLAATLALAATATL